MKSGRTFLCVAILALLAVLALLWVGVRVAGVRAFYGNHVIATFEIAGLADPGDAADLRAELAGRTEVRAVELARDPASEEIWWARIQFHAESPAQGAKRIRAWIEDSAPDHPMQLVRATHYRYRVVRPDRGDLVFGPRREIVVAP